MKRLGWLVLIFLAGSTLPAHARVELQKKGPVQIEFRADDSIALSDTISVILSVEGTPDLSVIVPGEPPADSAWTLVQRGAEHRQAIGPNRVRWSIEFAFAPRAPGARIGFTFSPVTFRDGKEEQTVEFAPVHFTVTTQIARVDLANLHGVPSIEPTTPIVPTDFTWLWWTILAGVTVLGLMAAIVLRLWLRTTVWRSPAHLALQEWRRLIGMKLPEQGKSERFITLLTSLVRRYLDRQFALPARRQTTPEFLRHVAHSAALTPEEKQFLTAFLESCEAVKFANVEMAPEECLRWAEATRQFLERRLQLSARSALSKN